MTPIFMLLSAFSGSGGSGGPFCPGRLLSWPLVGERVLSLGYILANWMIDRVWWSLSGKRKALMSTQGSQLFAAKLMEAVTFIFPQCCPEYKGFCFALFPSGKKENSVVAELDWGVEGGNEVRRMQQGNLLHTEGSGEPQLMPRMLPHVGGFLLLATKGGMQHTRIVVCALLVPLFPPEFLRQSEALSGYPGALGTSYPDLPPGPIKLPPALGVSSCPLYIHRSL